ncbi:YopX family protein [Staphylococcus epidermidis]|nr:YopX family protein [Staphylococcus epidermidis]MCG2517830.1 YopX family protein [Staphylococcus epidermidis]
MIPKFRAWDKNNKYMKYTDKNLVVCFSDEGASAVDHITFGHSCTCMEDIELMQSTGLKDINGVEIYEGDILKTSIKNLVVEWVPKGACWGIGCHYLFHYYETSEVIGNIYENPDLLEDN